MFFSILISADAADGQVSNGVAVGRIEVERDLSSTVEDPDVEIVESSHIWYACYGSNMYKPRFMCYIEGGKVRICILKDGETIYHGLVSFIMKVFVL